MFRSDVFPYLVSLIMYIFNQKTFQSRLRAESVDSVQIKEEEQEAQRKEMRIRYQSEEKDKEASTGSK